MALTTLLALASASYVTAQEVTLSWAPTPLISKSFPQPSDAPYQVYPASEPFVRGPQTGYNICNSTTEGQNSQCQTAYFNSPSDFCIWAPPDPNTSIGDSEGYEVAWCTQPGHGARVIPSGTIKGFQILQNNDYWMITGNLDQTKVNIQAGDGGGELDSGAQDGRGNPIGGLMYSTGFGQSSPHQITWWTEFIGNNQFCVKICNPKGNNNPGYCQHTLDEIGVAYNCPSKYTLNGGFQDGEFEVCQTDDMTVPGIYVVNGQTLSYAQPPESAGPPGPVPYTPTAAASSSCTPLTSASLFAASSTTTSGASKTTSKGSSGTSGGSGPAATGGSGALANTVSIAALAIAGVASFVLLA